MRAAVIGVGHLGPAPRADTRVAAGRVARRRRGHQRRRVPRRSPREYGTPAFGDARETDRPRRCAVIAVPTESHAASRCR